jgi:hypothetical protein
MIQSPKTASVKFTLGIALLRGASYPHAAAGVHGSVGVKLCYIAGDHGIAQR